jgi:hypothetical protein
MNGGSCGSAATGSGSALFVARQNFKGEEPEIKKRKDKRR